MSNKKNFETLEVGCWYQARSGDFLMIKEKVTVDKTYPFRSSFGSYQACGSFIHPNDPLEKDLILKIEPPVIVPAKPKRKVKVEFFMNIYPQFIVTHKTKEESERNAQPDRLDCIHIEREYEVEDK